MKYCTKCGNQLVDAAVVCVRCGCPTGSVVSCKPAKAKEEKGESTLSILAKVFMIIGTVYSSVLIIPLAWCIPMTISYFSKVKNKQPVSTGFKICVLLFVSMLGGIFMLCDEEQ